MTRLPWLRRIFAASALISATIMPNDIGAQDTVMMSNVPVPLVQLTAPLPEDIACNVLPQYTDLVYRLPRLARRLEAGVPVTIVALGSSSTAGAGASSPLNTYPARLQDELRRMFQSDDISVINRGVNGEKAGDMLARLASDVLNENPDLVIFQGDVNSILANVPVEPAVAAMDSIIGTLKSREVDVVLMDAQFAPRVNTMPNAGVMQDAMLRLGREHRVGVFPRNALMRHWHERQSLKYDQFLSGDALHMKDWSYACAARVLAHAIGNSASAYPVRRLNLTYP